MGLGRQTSRQFHLETYADTFFLIAHRIFFLSPSANLTLVRPSYAAHMANPVAASSAPISAPISDRNSLSIRASACILQESISAQLGGERSVFRATNQYMNYDSPSLLAKYLAQHMSLHRHIGNGFDRVLGLFISVWESYSIPALCI